MISVTRNSHIPRVEASFCCSTESKWCSSAGEWLDVDNLHSFLRRVGVSRLCHHRHDVEILRGRRRCGLPLQSLRAPWIDGRPLSPFERPKEVRHWQRVAERQNRSASRRHDVQHLEFFRISMIPSRHAEVAEYKLREERQVESDE